MAPQFSDSLLVLQATEETPRFGDVPVGDWFFADRADQTSEGVIDSGRPLIDWKNLNPLRR